MPTPSSRFFVYAALISVAAPLWAQQAAEPQNKTRQEAVAPKQQADGVRPRPQDTEVWEPIPEVVTPGATVAAPPSDAIVLFDGKNLDEWVSTRDKSPAKWFVADGVMAANNSPGVGSIETKRAFKNYQLHIEWRIPEKVTGTDQARGNSGVFLASTGRGDAGYELQVLDS